MKGKVSIIIPLFNREALIVETLKSVLNQSYQVWEAIIVDDHSTDDSYTTALAEAKKDARIKVYKRDSKVKGAPSCRNIGIARATGEFIIFLDSDDVLAPYCLEERVGHFQNHHDKDFLVFNSSFFTDSITDSHVFWNKFTKENDLNRFLRGDNVWCISSPLWKRQSILENQLNFMESAKSSQDWEFHVKALYKKLSYLKIDELPDFFIRRNTTQGLNAISSGHGNFNKLYDRFEMYSKLFSEYRLTRKQSSYLFMNIENEIFNGYHKYSFNNLNILFNKVKKIQGLNLFKINFCFYAYFVLHTSSKFSFNKSHQLVYYFKRNKTIKNKLQGYRTPMTIEEQKNLISKLNHY